jgi:tRNA(His) 5'-end guanylyltransferase
MAIKDALGDRMKEYYENRSKTYLTRRTPVIIRLDGKAFHSFSRSFKKPYDEILHNAMNATMLYLCKNVQGCKFGYTQSDEITLILKDDDKLTTDAWFDYSVQKMCSISASMATLAFNKALEKEIHTYETEFLKISHTPEDITTYQTYVVNLNKALAKGAMFDSRCFNIPESEVVNACIWRENDATRNAIQMLGHCHFSDKALEGKSNNEVQDMLFLERGINFNDMPTEFKRGVCCIKKEVPSLERLIGYKKEWVLDKEIPIFTQNPEYILNAIDMATNKE